jgi:hypothetical protein
MRSSRDPPDPFTISRDVPGFREFVRLREGYDTRFQDPNESSQLWFVASAMKIR